ncbi:MAG TPA: hypothetical protein PLQ56_14185 [Aggregatilineales bacterium]|nr:hypothetical protein [Aggregatilineales bacterium]
MNPELEYTALREEILKRIESRQQLISITLTIAAAVLGVGWTSGAVILLIYPLIATLMAAGWAQNEMMIRQITAYIRDHLEGKVTEPGWERTSRAKMTETMVFGWPMDILALGGIFVLTQIMALALGWTRFNNSALEWILLVADGVGLIVVLSLLNMVRDRTMAGTSL